MKPDCVKERLVCVEMSVGTCMIKFAGDQLVLMSMETCSINISWDQSGVGYFILDLDFNLVLHGL